MSDAKFNELFDLFADAPEDPGLERAVLPAGTYHVQVDVQDTGLSSAKQTPYADLALTVLSGPHEGRKAFVRHWLMDVFLDGGASLTAAIHAVKRDPKHAPDEAKKLAKRFNWNSTLVKYLGIDGPARVAPASFETTGQASIAYWRVPEWAGRALIVGIGIETAESQKKRAEEMGRDPGDPIDRNRMRSWRPATPEALSKLAQKYETTDAPTASSI